MTVRSRTTAALLAVAAALVMMAAAPAAGAAASPATAGYALSGTATMTPGTGFCLDCLPPSASATGTATCSLCLPGKPGAGTFTLDLPAITTHPPNPCRIKTISGPLSATWDTGQTSTATVSGRFIDGKPILTLTGTFSPADPIWPADPVDIVLTNFPPNPCTAAINTVTGDMAISAS